MKRVEKDILDGKEPAGMAVEFSAALGLAYAYPIGRPVACAAKACCFDKGFQECRPVAVAVLPVRRQALGHGTQDTGSEIGRGDPGQYQEASVVDHEMKVAGAFLIGPADKLVAGRDFPGGRSKSQDSEQVRAGEDKIPELCAGQRLVAEVMVALDELIAKRRVLWGDEPELEFAQGPGWKRDRRLRMRSEGQTGLGPTVSVALERRGQNDEAIAVHAQHDYPAGHFLATAIGLDPTEGVAHRA